MDIEAAIHRSEESTDTQSTFVCSLCGRTFSSPQQLCTCCDGNLVVPVGETEVYETVIPMCGPDYPPNQCQ